MLHFRDRGPLRSRPADACFARESMAKEPKIVPFGKYELLEKIAVGGMAEIFKARTKGVGGFEKYLAIKRILPHLSENKDFIDMLINEAKIAVMLSHANIVQIYDLGKIDDSYFIAMEYIEGKDLRALMTRCDQIGMPLFIQHAIFIAIEVCKGLEYAHSKTDNARELNIVHRDISPQNVMISYEGEVKITDFGIAKANVNISETEAGVVKGKYEYMSPEQASGLPVDRRTDIFSTAIVLYEMLTGQKPFRGESDLTILERVREAKVDPPSKYNKSIPKKLEKIVLKGLAKEQADRYQTSTELKDELTRFFYSSTFNFTTSNLAAFMKSIFAEEIKLDVLTDADGGTGIGKRPDFRDDGNTISRIFGKPSSDKFKKNGTGPTDVGMAIGALTTDSNPVSSVNGGEGGSSSRTLGGEALASIEEEINRILIPGKTNVGKVPTAATAPEASRATSATAPASIAAANAAAISATSAIPRDETGSRPTLATPRPASPSSAGMGLGDLVQSAAMELAMEIEMAMPPLSGPSRIGPAPRAAGSGMQSADDSNSEAATEAGRGMEWNGSEEPLESRIDARMKSNDASARDRSTEERAPTFNVEVDEGPGAAGSASGKRESTIVSPKSNTQTGSKSMSGARPLSAVASSPSIQPGGSKSKAPMRIAKERIRGVTVNAPNPDLEEDAPPRREKDREDEDMDSSGTAASPDDRIDNAARGESTVIGKKPMSIAPQSPVDGGTEPGVRRQPSISRTLNSAPPPSEETRRDPSRSSPRVAKLGPVRDDSDFAQAGDDFDAPVPAPQPRRNRTAPVDEQADLYPAPAKRVSLHPAVLMLLAAIVFFAGVVLAKLL